MKLLLSMAVLTFVLQARAETCAQVPSQRIGTTGCQTTTGSSFRILPTTSYYAPPVTYYRPPTTNVAPPTICTSQPPSNPTSATIYFYDFPAGAQLFAVVGPGVRQGDPDVVREIPEFARQNTRILQTDPISNGMSGNFTLRVVYTNGRGQRVARQGRFAMRPGQVGSLYLSDLAPIDLPPSAPPIQAPPPPIPPVQPPVQAPPPPTNQPGPGVGTRAGNELNAASRAALVRAQSLLAQGNALEAVEVLEENLFQINGSSEYLRALQTAYERAIPALRTRNEIARATTLQARLAILAPSGSTSRSGTATAQR